MLLGPYRFANPEFFWLLLLIPVLIFWYIWKYRKKLPVQTISGLQMFNKFPRSWKEYLSHSLFVFRIFTIILIIIAIAKPQSSYDKHKVKTEGIDIVIALDISSTMLARDFSPDRLGAAKKVAINFIEGRKNDRIGFVVFSSESFTQCPITTDHTILINLINEVKSGMIEDGTAIGHGLATAVDRLRTSPGKSRVVILLTDGMNNAGFINPATAADIARQYNIRVYTIGVGTMGMAPYPVQTPFGMSYQNMEVQIDEPLLKQIAETTGGSYYRAVNNRTLKEIYEKIDQMEKAKIELTSYRHFTDKYLPFALLAGIFLFLEIMFRYTVFKYLP